MDCFVEDGPLIAPLEVGRGLRLGPVGATPGDGLVIDADGTFGTGTHPTTRLLLDRIASRASPGVRVLDVGTGSGILALAAAWWGACALGVDLDPLAVARADENRERNGIAACLSSHGLDHAAMQQFYTAPQHHHSAMQRASVATQQRRGCARFVLGSDVGGAFDLIVANLDLRSLVAAGASLGRRVAAGGQLIVSGVLLVDASRCERALAAIGLRVVARVAAAGWALFELRATS